MEMRITNAFTCTGAYAILIMTGLKRVENRSAFPSPDRGRCAVSVSKKFCRDEYDNLMLWLKDKVPNEVYATMPSWEDVKNWPGRIVGTIDYWIKRPYECTREDLAERRMWQEGYGVWWNLANPLIFKETIQCRGYVGFWKLPADVAERVDAAEKMRVSSFKGRTLDISSKE